MKILISILIGYFIGSINCAYILGKINGFDIRDKNSHNPGAANAKLTFGWWGFAVVWIGDTLKAVLAYYLIKYLFASIEYSKYIGTAFAVVGHCFPITMKLKGGKGFSSFGGVVLALSPIAYLIGALIAVIVGLTCNSLAALTLASLLAGPIVMYFTGSPIIAICSVIFAALVAAYRHKKNFHNLFTGVRDKIFDSKPAIQDYFEK